MWSGLLDDSVKTSDHTGAHLWPKKQYFWDYASECTAWSSGVWGGLSSFPPNFYISSDRQPEDQSVFVVVNFLSQLIVIFLCFNVISIHSDTQKQKKNKITWDKKIILYNNSNTAIMPFALNFKYLLVSQNSSSLDIVCQNFIPRKIFQLSLKSDNPLQVFRLRVQFYFSSVTSDVTP